MHPPPPPPQWEPSKNLLLDGNDQGPEWKQARVLDASSLALELARTCERALFWVLGGNILVTYSQRALLILLFFSHLFRAGDANTASAPPQQPETVSNSQLGRNEKKS